MFPGRLSFQHKSHILHESAIYANHTYHSGVATSPFKLFDIHGCSLTSIDDTRPSCMRITRSAIGAIAELCVTITTVAPFLRLSCPAECGALVCQVVGQARRSVRQHSRIFDSSPPLERSPRRCRRPTTASGENCRRGPCKPHCRRAPAGVLRRERFVRRVLLPARGEAGDEVVETGIRSRCRCGGMRSCRV